MNDIPSLHAAWCSASGQELNPRATERIFFELAKMDFTADDVRIAVTHLMAFNRKSGGAKFRINAFKVLGDPETFASLVAEARAAQRNKRPAPTEKDKIIQLRERVVDAEQSSTMTQNNGHHVSEFLRKPN